MDGHFHASTDTVGPSWAPMSSESWNTSSMGETQIPDGICLDFPWFMGHREQQEQHQFVLQQQLQQQSLPSSQAQRLPLKYESHQQTAQQRQEQQPPFGFTSYFQNPLPTPLQTPLGTPSNDPPPHFYNSFQTTPSFDSTNIQPQPVQEFQLAREYFPQSPTENMTPITNTLSVSQHIMAPTAMPISHSVPVPIISPTEPSTQGFESHIITHPSATYKPRAEVQVANETRQHSVSTLTMNSVDSENKPQASNGPLTTTDNHVVTATAVRGDLHDGEESEEDAEEFDTEESRRLYRNRIAASKCRLKRKDEADRLEILANKLQATNDYLLRTQCEMREEVYFLKNEVLRHSECESSLIQGYLLKEAKRVADGSSTPAPRYSTMASRFVGMPRTSRRSQ